MACERDDCGAYATFVARKGDSARRFANMRRRLKGFLIWGCILRQSGNLCGERDAAAYNLWRERKDE